MAGRGQKKVRVAAAARSVAASLFCVVASMLWDLAASTGVCDSAAITLPAINRAAPPAARKVKFCA